MRHGFFGGTFDPIHFGHLIAAETVLSECRLDRVYFIPTANPPHKTSKELSPTHVRMNMVRLAIKTNPYFIVLDIEISEQTAYSIDTVETILDDTKLAGVDPVWIVGMDSLAEMTSWKTPEKLLSKIQVVVVQRPGIAMQGIPEKYTSKVQWVESPSIGLSSSEIRKRVKCGKSIRYQVPDAVREYIQKKRLYL
ncbi:MAG TPA: nicotinate (nicotinamide) nucleotide adenylyltransferase [bacterium]|nr:nicotinate (nicotinamide) nucleotide adenylyltransferase [bacterium]